MELIRASDMSARSLNVVEIEQYNRLPLYLAFFPRINAQEGITANASNKGIWGAALETLMKVGHADSQRADC